MTSDFKKGALYKKEERCWCLTLPEKGWTVSSLTGNESLAIIATLNKREKSRLLCWKPNWNCWVLWKDPLCKELHKHWNSELFPPPVERTGGFRDRKHERYDFHVPARFIVGSRSFQTITENISTGGMYLKESLPEWIAGYFTIILDLADFYDTSQITNLELVGSIIEQEVADRFRIQILPSERQDSLTDWLKLQSQQKIYL